MKQNQVNEDTNLTIATDGSPRPAPFSPPISKPTDSIKTTRKKARLAVAGYAQSDRARIDIDVALFVMGNKLDVFRESVVEFTGEGGSCSVMYWTYSKTVPAAKGWADGWHWVTPYSGYPEDARKVEKRIQSLNLTAEYAAALSRITGGNLFAAINATPKERCIAALEVVNVPERETEIGK